jgi:hypothetical protein
VGRTTLCGWRDTDVRQEVCGCSAFAALSRTQELVIRMAEDEGAGEKCLLRKGLGRHCTLGDPSPLRYGERTRNPQLLELFAEAGELLL